MSNSMKILADDTCTKRPCNGVELLIHPKTKDLGGFSVRRALPSSLKQMIGPWIFFDHMGPATFSPGLGLNVRPHPHINLCTVSYLFEGEILHRDSLGSVQLIKPGDINLMVAGKGIVHSERERPEVTQQERKIHGLQLWLALPLEQEEIEPEFLHYPSQAIPVANVDGIQVRVIMGEAYGASSPVKTFAETLYIESLLHKGESLRLPTATERALYVAEGCVSINDVDITEHSLAVLKEGSDIEIVASKESRIALIGGEPVGERFIEWNFISSDKARIEKAKEDWESQKFPKVPEDDKEFIPLPK